MPNGFHGPEEKWNDIEAPLRQIDSLLDAYGKSRRLAVTSNDRNWPSGSFEWGDVIKKIGRPLQLHGKRALAPKTTSSPLPGESRGHAGDQLDD